MSKKTSRVIVVLAASVIAFLVAFVVVSVGSRYSGDRAVIREAARMGCEEELTQKHATLGKVSLGSDRSFEVQVVDAEGNEVGKIRGAVISWEPALHATFGKIEWHSGK